VTDWEAVVQGWCEQLPQGVLDALATVALAGPAMVAQTLQSASSAPVLRAAQLTREAVDAGDGPYLAGLLRGVRMAKADVPALRAVWTGPESAAASGRLTLAVVADLLSEAADEVLLVSYAAYPAPDIVAALTAAVARGVSVTLLLEREGDAPDGFHGHANPFAGVAATRLRWRRQDRAEGASLHAKMVVVDRRVALVGSANITSSAMLKNLECGLLVRGGSVPGELVRHVLGCSEFVSTGPRS